MAPTPPRGQATEFVFAGTSACCAIAITNPLDVVKTRLNLQGELAQPGVQQARAYRGICHALWKIGSSEGFRGLQRGLCPAWLLQFSNVGCRFGGYSTLKELFGVKPGESATGWLTSIGLGAASGALAGVVSSPFFLLKSRFQAVGSEDVRHQHAHRTLRGAVTDIWLHEGVGGFYRGLSAFVPRVAVASSIQLSTYDVSKAKIIKYTGLGDTMYAHFGASLLTGIAVTYAMQPFDFASTRVMNQQVDSAGKGILYAGPVDCIIQSVRTEGIQGVYKGALASYARFGPYCILTFVFLEQFRSAWDKHILARTQQLS